MNILKANYCINSLDLIMITVLKYRFVSTFYQKDNVKKNIKNMKTE